MLVVLQLHQPFPFPVLLDQLLHAALLGILVVARSFCSRFAALLGDRLCRRLLPTTLACTTFAGQQAIHIRWRGQLSKLCGLMEFGSRFSFHWVGLNPAGLGWDLFKLLTYISISVSYKQSLARKITLQLRSILERLRRVVEGSR